MRPKTYYPAFLDLDCRLCVVVGGGRVALRKVEMLREAGACVTVVAPVLCEELEAMRSSGVIQAKTRSFVPSDLDEALVAVAATDDRAANERVASEARMRRVLVNVVDVPALCDFIVPSYIRRGVITIAISTSGGSPALAKRLRIALESEFGEEYGVLAEIVGQVRTQLKDDGVKASAAEWESALDLVRLLDLLRDGKHDEAKRALINALNQDRKATQNAS